MYMIQEVKDMLRIISLWGFLYINIVRILCLVVDCGSSKVSI